ncbi:MAG TPA: Gfo/Idh/MocA family oxidoreductase [Bacteroidales bacterium]|nr:Gfo/Idh/MocA family oxidoreductase [Bacteroidales bacterium]
MINRRKFLTGGLAAVAGAGIMASFPLTAKAFAGSPNDKIVAGAIGINGMGFADLQAFLRQPNTECAALCDVDENVLNARALEVEKIQGKKPALYKDFRKLLEDKSLDVVIIGTPDHWHCLPFIYALQAGKNVYSEKPLSNSVQEIDLMQKAAKKYGKVVQIGQWQRSDPHWQDAVAFVHSGKLGKIRTVRAWSYQGWMKSVPVVPDEPVPAGVDYDFWLGPAPLRPFNKNRFHFTFRWFWDYAGGMMTDWGVHILDYALFGMNAGQPKSVMAMGGKFAYPEDACETPDTLQALYEFNDFTLLWDHAIGIDGGYYGRSHGVGFVGNLGTLVVDRNGWEVIPEPGNGKALMESVPLKKGNGKGLENHMKNFLACIRDSSVTPNAGIDIGAHIARVANLGNIAYRTGRRLYWNGDTSSFINDTGADAYLKANYRKPWELPTL